MAKIKNRKRISVDQIHKKRQSQNVKKLNPFEVHINKEKMKVLGKKLKNEKGLPGVSRAKAIQKRKRTLLHEYKLQHKSNKFMDRRIREKSEMSEEEKAVARFAAVRLKAHNKKNIDDPEYEFNLTHKSQSLSEIEKYEYDDLHSIDDESEDEDQTGRLDSNFVEDAHFGGDLFKNSGKEGAKTHKQLIEQLIEESKKRKAEKQKIKEATVELTEKLDSEWKDLIQLVSKSSKTEEKKDIEKPQPDDYDKVMRELKFEARGTVSDRLKTEDEIAKEEKEKLEKLEQERLERMGGFVKNNAIKQNHRSADDLDDNFVYESDTEENMLSYDQKGQSNVHVHAELNGKTLGDEVENSEKQGDSENDSEEEDAEEQEDESDSEDSLADLKEDHESDEESEVETKESKEVKKGTKSTAEVTEHKNKNKKCKVNDILSAQNSKKSSETESKKPDIINDLSKTEKKELEKAGRELPFTFSLPETYENFIEILKERSINHQKIILERMIKCNHPSLSQGNKEGLGILFQYLLQYINDIFSDIDNSKGLKESFQTFRALMPHIYDLAQLNKENTHNSVLAVIKEKQEDYRKKKKKYPSLEVLAFLKLTDLLFTTSDFRHQIVTPCFIFIEQMLRYCTVKNAVDISFGIMLCTLVLEYTSLTNRYLPAAVNFLAGILHMAIPKTSVKVIKVLPPFKSLSSDLVLTTNLSNIKVSHKLPVNSLVEKKMTDDFKVTALFVTLKLVQEFMVTYKNLSSNVEIFEVVEKYLQQIPTEFYPENVRKEHKDICDNLAELESTRKLHYLVMEQKKPKALRLYEPKIVEVYDGKRHKVQSKEKAERAKLLHKLKKETKGALREIRRDKAFLSRVQINEKIKSDKERKEKVNRIFREAATQQGELNALGRNKKKGK